MPQTPVGAVQNPWLIHLPKCALEYRRGQAEKANVMTLAADALAPAADALVAPTAEARKVEPVRKRCRH